MLTSKKLLIAAICYAFAGHCNVMYGMNNNANNQQRGLFATSSQATALPPTEEEKGSKAVSEGGYGNTLSRTALMDVIYLRPAVAIAFINECVAVDQKSSDGVTALMFAAAHGSPNIVKALLEKGADVNLKDSSGRTALMIATSDGNLDVVKELLAKDADVNAQNNNGSTALHMLIEYIGQKYTVGSNVVPMYKLIIELLKHGAKTSIINNFGETPLDQAQNSMFNDLDPKMTISKKVIMPRVIALIIKSRKKYLADRMSILKTYMIPDIAKSIVSEY